MFATADIASFRSLKRELVRAQEEIKRIQSVPLVIGQFMEAIDQKYENGLTVYQSSSALLTDSARAVLASYNLAQAPTMLSESSPHSTGSF